MDNLRRTMFSKRGLTLSSYNVSVNASYRSVSVSIYYNGESISDTENIQMEITNNDNYFAYLNGSSVRINFSTNYTTTTYRAIITITYKGETATCNIRQSAEALASTTTNNHAIDITSASYITSAYNHSGGNGLSVSLTINGRTGSSVIKKYSSGRTEENFVETNTFSNVRIETFTARFDVASQQFRVDVRVNRNSQNWRDVNSGKLNIGDSPFVYDSGCDVKSIGGQSKQYYFRSTDSYVSPYVRFYDLTSYSSGYILSTTSMPQAQVAITWDGTTDTTNGSGINIEMD